MHVLIFQEQGAQILVRLANKLGVSRHTVKKWGREIAVPPKHCLQLECVTGVSRHELRPDIYPLEEDGRGRRARHRESNALNPAKVSA